MYFCVILGCVEDDSRTCRMHVRWFSNFSEGCYFFIEYKFKGWQLLKTSTNRYFINSFKLMDTYLYTILHVVFVREKYIHHPFHRIDIL